MTVILFVYPRRLKLSTSSDIQKYPMKISPVWHLMVEEFVAVSLNYVEVTREKHNIANF